MRDTQIPKQTEAKKKEQTQKQRKCQKYRKKRKKNKEQIQLPIGIPQNNRFNRSHPTQTS
jgi:hypothetical protein